MGKNGEPCRRYYLNGRLRIEGGRLRIEDGPGDLAFRSSTRNPPSSISLWRASCGGGRLLDRSSFAVAAASAAISQGRSGNGQEEDRVPGLRSRRRSGA